MLAKPEHLVNRDAEWDALQRFVERRQGLGLVYGPRRVGKSYLIGALAEAAGGLVYQAVTGTLQSQLRDFGRELGGWLGAGSLQPDDWNDALERLSRVDAPFVAIDELPYLIQSSPELPSMIQRYVDGHQGPPLLLSGSAMSVMSEFVLARSPLFGRAGTVLVPRPFTGEDLSLLWDTRDPRECLWIDAALGGLPGYRPLVDLPEGDLDRWMTDQLLAPGSPLLDAAEAALGELHEAAALRAPLRSILNAIATGERSFSGIARVAGIQTGALTRPLSALQRAGLVNKVPDPLRPKRAGYELSDPHLGFWLSVIAPNRSRLLAGQSAAVWGDVSDSTWPAQVLGPRWESVVRDRIEAGAVEGVDAAEKVGRTEVSDRSERNTYEVDVIATKGKRVVALGEAKLRPMRQSDVDRLRRIRDLLGADDAKLIFASASPAKVDRQLGPDVIALSPADLY